MTPISDAYQREHARKRDTDPKDCQYNKGLECGMECARHVEEMLRQAHKDFGCELRDPYGTIWEHTAKVQAENVELKARITEMEARK